MLYDADLSPLGKPRQAYWSDNASIRAEYGFASDTQWREGRAEFIRSFLDRPHIFHTGEGIRRFEQQARDNLHDELDVLTLEAFQTPPSTAAG